MDEDVLPPDETEAPPPPTPAAPRRIGFDTLGQRYSREDRIKLSGLLASAKSSPVISDFLSTQDGVYSGGAREGILYHGVADLLSQGLDPASPEFTAALEAYAQSPAAQEQLSNVKAFEFFNPRGANDWEGDSAEGYEKFLDQLNNPEESARRRAAMAQYEDIIGSLGDTNGLDMFGGSSASLARQRLLNEGGDAFRQWVEQNVGGERAARDQARELAKALGYDDDNFASQPGQGWQSTLAYLQAQQKYKSASDAFTGRRMQAKDRRNINELESQWRGMQSPWSAPQAPPNSQQPLRPGQQWWERNQPAANQASSAGGMGATSNPFAAFTQNPGSQWSPTGQVPMTPQQQRRQPTTGPAVAPKPFWG